MIQKEFIPKEQINIIVVLNEKSDQSFFQDILNYASTYLNLNVEYINNFNIKKTDVLTINNSKKIDFYFVDFVKEYEYIFAWNFYSKMHNLNKNFKLVLFKDKIEEVDVRYFKNGADDIIYTDKNYSLNNEWVRWKIFALLRRRWDKSHNDTTLNRHGVIIDLVKRKVIVNNKEIKVTGKEFEVLTILINEFNSQKDNYLSKNKLYKKIYGIDNKRNSRVIDQLIFRLKNKFPSEFFAIDKRKGIKII